MLKKARMSSAMRCRNSESTPSTLLSARSGARTGAVPKAMKKRVQVAMQAMETDSARIHPGTRPAIWVPTSEDPVIAGPRKNAASIGACGANGAPMETRPGATGALLRGRALTASAVGLIGANEAQEAMVDATRARRRSIRIRIIVGDPTETRACLFLVSNHVASPVGSSSLLSRSGTVATVSA